MAQGAEAKRELFSEQRLSPLEINLLSSLSRERRLAPGEEVVWVGQPTTAWARRRAGRAWRVAGSG